MTGNGGNNMKKRISALLLAIVFIFSIGSDYVNANLQIPVKSVSVDNVYYVVGQDNVTGEAVISPTMTVSWTDPDKWGDAPDVANIHAPDYYEVRVNNKTNGKTFTIQVDKGSTEFTNKRINLHEKMIMDTGSLYEVVVQPYHFHENASGVKELAQLSGIAKKAYAVTDLQVDFESDENSIKVIWDDLGVPDFQYRIVYALGDYTGRTKDDILNNKEGEIVGLTSDSQTVTKYYDPVLKKNKLSYTISENVFPGQVYSVMVEPLVEYYDGYTVTRNRNYPYIKSVSTNISLSLNEEGDYLRLQWQIPASFQVGQNNDQYALVEAKLVQYVGGQSANIAIFNADAAVIGYYRISKPDYETEFELQLTYKAVDDQSKPSIQPVSNRLKYVPAELKIQPTKPVVPKVMSNKILLDLREKYTLEQIRTILADEYLVPGSTYLDSLDQLLTKGITFNLLPDDFTINFVWSAFRRIDIDPTSSTYNSYITDLNVYYDIWVSNSLEGLVSAPKIVSDQRFASNNEENIIKDAAGTVVGYKHVLDSYYDELKSTVVNIIPNQIYYIKVVAKKKTSTGDIVSEPTISTIYFTYGGDVYEPPMIVKPPLKVQSDKTTANSVTLAWKEFWWETIDPTATSTSALSSWIHEAWVTTSGAVSTKEVNGATYFPIYNSEAEAIRFKDYMTTLGLGSNIIRRKIDLGKDAFGLSDVKYKFNAIPYSTVQAAILEKQKTNAAYSFKDYYDALVLADKNSTNLMPWENITPLVDSTDTNYLTYKRVGLLPNTSYLFMLYPYRVGYNGDILYAHYPTPMVVSTNPADVVVNPEPTVPNLYITGYTDMTMSVSWKYNTDFQYELVYGLVDDVTKADPVPWSVPTSPLDPKYPKNGQFYEVKVTDLFPNTQYHFWIRAKQVATSKLSQWSNPAVGSTLGVDAPVPPRGLGVASLDSLKSFNILKNITENYLAIEWLKDVEDVDNTDSEAAVNKYYAYIVEIADNPKFIDPQYIVSAGGKEDVVPSNIEILAKNLVQANELIPNRYYYIRAKTRLTVKGKVAGQLIVKDSTAYTQTVRILTLATGEEYDGTKDPALEILPGSDYEIVYNADTKSLDYRFRDDGVGQDGAADNNVDQRFISNLVNQNIYSYTIDVSSYKSKPITQRTISIPYSIMEALSQFKVNLLINAGNMKIQVPYGAFDKEIKRQVGQYGVAPTVKISLSDVDAYYYPEQMPTDALSVVSTPQEVKVSVNSDRVNKTVSYTDKELTFNMKTTDRYSMYGLTPVTYAKDGKLQWTNVQGKYDANLGASTFTTAKMGTYGTYILNTNPTSTVVATGQTTHWSEPYRQKINGLYTLKGFGTYNPTTKVTEKALGNILYGAISGESIIDVAASLPADKTNALYRAGVKPNTTYSGTTTSRESAVAMFVRAYEIKQDTKIVPTAAALAAANKDTKVGTAYKQAVAKAITLGFVANSSKIRAKDAITYGEVFSIWSKIEQ